LPIHTLYNSLSHTLSLLSLLCFYYVLPGNRSHNTVDSSASMFCRSCSCWLAPISQLFMAATSGHCLPHSRMCPPLGNTDCLQTHPQSQLPASKLTKSSSWLLISPQGGPRRKHCFQQCFYCCMCNRCYADMVFTDHCVATDARLILPLHVYYALMP
jgi:hypothetical protein